MLGVRLPEILDRRLSSLSKSTQRPKSFYVKEAIEQYLNEYEEIYKAVSEYERDKKNGTLILRDMKDVMKDLNIDEKDLGSEIF